MSTASRDKISSSRQSHEEMLARLKRKRVPTVSSSLLPDAVGGSTPVVVPSSKPLVSSGPSRKRNKSEDASPITNVYHFSCPGNYLANTQSALAVWTIAEKLFFRRPREHLESLTLVELMMEVAILQLHALQGALAGWEHIMRLEFDLKNAMVRVNKSEAKEKVSIEELVDISHRLKKKDELLLAGDEDLYDLR